VKGSLSGSWPDVFGDRGLRPRIGPFRRSWRSQVGQACQQAPRSPHKSARPLRGEDCVRGRSSSARMISGRRFGALTASRPPLRRRHAPAVRTRLEPVDATGDERVPLLWRSTTRILSGAPRRPTAFSAKNVTSAIATPPSLATRLGDRQGARQADRTRLFSFSLLLTSFCSSAATSLSSTNSRLACVQTFQSATTTVCNEVPSCGGRCTALPLLRSRWVMSTIQVGEILAEVAAAAV